MKLYLKSFLVFIILVSLFVGCKQDYTPQLREKNVRLLVVEGFLNSGQGVTTIFLSRTTNLTDTAAIRKEINAKLVVESDNGTSFNLIENAPGEYSNAQLNLSNNSKYRLRIKTRDGKEYVSEYSTVRNTPPVDSITWKREVDGVRLYVHTHDPQNKTRYYLWDYDETWEYHSPYTTSLKYIRNSFNDIIDVTYLYSDHTTDTTIYKCWKTVKSTSIIIGSSERLTSDVIYSPFNFIPEATEQLGVLYSVNLKQQAVSHEKYLFFEKMKKNTEQLGTLFDAQPTQLAGNIHCLTDPNEIVIGFVEISEQQTKRKFIYNREIDHWNYRTECYEMHIDNIRDSLAKYANGTIPTKPDDVSPGGRIITFFASSFTCVDCRTGRSNQKPSFWP